MQGSIVDFREIRPRRFNDLFEGIPETGLKDRRLKWFSSDRPERCSPDHVDVEYRFNSNGYRAYHFDPNQRSILSVGCSITFGVGISSSDRFSSVIADRLGAKDYNVGWPGSSACYVSRMVYQSFDVLQPDFTIVTFPHSNRLETFDINGRQLDYRVDSKPRDVTEKKLIKSLRTVTSDYENIARFIKNFRLIETALAGTRWAYSLHRFDRERLESRLPSEKRIDSLQQIDTARDQMHPGVESHREYADRVLRKFNETD